MVDCFFFQAEDGIRYLTVTGVQTCALPISTSRATTPASQNRQPAARDRPRGASSDRAAGWSPGQPVPVSTSGSSLVGCRPAPTGCRTVRSSGTPARPGPYASGATAVTVLYEASLALHGKRWGRPP